MIEIYLSGTGNTKYCVERLVSLISSSAKAIPTESPDVITVIQQNEEIFIGYPTQFSNAPLWCVISLKGTLTSGKTKKYCVLQQWGLLVVTVLAVRQEYSGNTV